RVHGATNPARPTIHAVDIVRRTKDDRLRRGSANMRPGLPIVSAAHHPPPTVRVDAGHIDNAARVRLVDLSVAVRVLILVHSIPVGSSIARAPGPDVSASTLSHVQPRSASARGSPGVDEEEGSRAPVFIHSSGHRNARP